MIRCIFEDVTIKWSPSQPLDVQRGYCSSYSVIRKQVDKRQRENAASKIITPLRLTTISPPRILLLHKLQLVTKARRAPVRTRNLRKMLNSQSAVPLCLCTVPCLEDNSPSNVMGNLQVLGQCSV